MAKRPQYDSPGSFQRILEAGIALADTDSDDDVAWHANEMRLRQALKAHAPKVIASLGGRARAAKLTPEQRQEVARIAARARWMLAGKHEPPEPPETPQDPNLQ